MASLSPCGATLRRGFNVPRWRTRPIALFDGPPTRSFTYPTETDPLPIDQCGHAQTGRILAKYSKVFPSGESYITPGRKLKPFDTPLGRVGVLICSDRHIVDNFSTLGVQGAQMILILMDGAGRPQNTAVLRQRARDNQCVIVVANTWSSAIITSCGDVMLENYETESVVGGRIFFDTPSGRGRDNFHGRRPDLYGPLTDHSFAGTLFDEGADRLHRRKRSGKTSASG